jgi:Uma2 family endonuclease
MNLVLDDTIRIPIEFENLDEFRDWTKSAAYPERGDYFYLSGDLWVDLSRETLLQNQVKCQIAAVLGSMATQNDGLYFGDRIRFVNVDADLSCEPDGMFVSHAARKAGHVRWQKGPDSLEVIGSPDMVLEVVSSHSVQKDTVVLRELYHAAGIAEYWLVNPLSGRLSLDILRHSAKGYIPTRKAAGWVKSNVFGKSFRLTPDKIGSELPECQLFVR